MAVPYEHYENDEIEAAEDDLSLGSDEDPYAAANPPQSVAAARMQQYKDTFQDKWPLKIGAWLLAWGVMMLLLGLSEVVLVPLSRTTLEGPATDIHFNHRNLWGLGAWAGLLIILTGTLGLRASLFKSVTAVYLFLTSVIVDIVVYSALVILVLVSYSQGWTMKKAFPDDVALFYIHLAVSVSIPVALVLLLLAFLQYYEDVFCGDLQLCRRFSHCCMPCWCPRVVEPEELLDELIRNRPPSLPV